MNACDPDADIENLRKLIKINAGVDIKLTKKEICQAYQDIQDDKLPLPPLVMNSSRTYLVDKNSPLKPSDYEVLFDSTTKRADLKRIARKVNLKNVEQMTKSQIVEAIGKRLRYMKIHEPVKFARKRRVSVMKNTTTAVNNTAVNNMNRVVNTNANMNRVNTNVNMNRVNTNVNMNRVNTNVNMNRVNTNVNMNRVNTNVNRPQNKISKVTFPTGGLFRKNDTPKFLGGPRSIVKNSGPKEEKKGFFAGLFGKKKNKNFIATNKFKGSKNGYVFRSGEKGLGYYLNTGRVEGPKLPPTNVIQPPPTNEDLALDMAVAIVKKLDLKREKNFLNMIQLGNKKRKQIVFEAEKAKDDENQFSAFLDTLDISNTNRNNFKRRMATDDFKQIQIEAQLKADERANVARTNEEKMEMFLKATSLSNVNRQLFINRARKEGSNVNALIEEARQLNSDVKNQKLTNKQEQFRKILQNYNKLSDEDKSVLIQEVGLNVNANMMRQMADKLLQKRIDEKKNVIQQNLFSFLEPLEINQTNKNEFMRLFKNNGANVNAIKNQALKLQESKKLGDIEAKRTKLENRIEELGLNPVNKISIMNKFNNGNRNVDTLIEQAKNLKRKQNAETNNQALEEYILYLKTLPNLTNQDMKNLINSKNLNRNKALNLSKRKSAEKKDIEKKEFVGFLSELGLTNENRQKMINKYNSNTLTVNVLKNEAIGLRNTKISEKKAKLIAHMNGLGLNNESRKLLLTRIENTNLNTLKANANAIAKKNSDEKEMEDRKKLENYINSLGLNTNNKLNILNRNPSLNNGRKMANDKLQMKIKEKRNKDKTALSIYLNKLGLNNNEKTKFFNNFNRNVNINTIKIKANTYMKNKKSLTKSQKREELQKHMKNLGLTNQEQLAFLNKFNRNIDNADALKVEATKFVNQRNKQDRNMRRNELIQYLKTLNLDQTDVDQILKRFDETNTNISVLKGQAKEINNSRKQERRAKDEEEFMNYLNTLENLTANNRTVITSSLSSNFVSWSALKKSATNLAIQRAKERREKEKRELLNFANELGLNNTDKRKLLKKIDNGTKNLPALKVEAQELKNQKNTTMRVQQRQKLSSILSGLNLTNKNRTDFLEKFNDNTSTVNAIVNEARKLEANTIKTRRDELIVFMTNLGLEQNDRNLILKNFDVNPRSVNTLRDKAQKLKGQKNLQEQKRVREELSKYINTLNMLNKSNKKKLLANTTRSYNNVKNEANQLQQYKKAMKRNANTETLKEAIKNLNMNDQIFVIGKFNSQNITLNQMLKEVSDLKRKKIEEKRSEDRKELVSYMNGLNITETNKKKILKNYDSQAANFETLTNRATQINAAVRNKSVQRQELSKYINTLGINGTQLLQKFDSGRSTLDRLKRDADKMRSAINARELNSKRENIRRFMKNTLLRESNKKSFLNRVEINTNVDILKREIAELNGVIKGRSNALISKRSELSVFLNTLNNLTPGQRSGLIKRVVNANNDINPIKLEGEMLNKAAKNKRMALNKAQEERRIQQAEKQRAKDEQKLEKHLRSLKHLTSKEMESYLLDFQNEKATLQDLVAVSKAKNADNEKDKDDVRNYVRRSPIPQNKRNVYLKQLNTPHVNINPIKALVNADIVSEKIAIQKLIENVEAKLKTLTNVTADERARFKNRLRSESARDVLKEAEKLNSNRKSAKAAKNKVTKNVAESLRVLTTLTRNNRKAFMNRLNQNGPQKVISNAVALNSERKNVVRKAESAKKIAEEKRRLEEIAQKRRNIEEARIKGVRNQRIKNVATTLQSLTSLERENRKKFMNRLPTNGANKIVANATKLNVDRKRAIELEKKLAEDKKRAEEARVKAEEAKKRSQNLQTKRIATRLQGLTSLERENRKKFMNRLPTNGVQKVLENATTLNRERKDTVKKTREGVEWKLKQIGVKGSDLQSLMKRWNDSKNKTIFDEARKKVEEERSKQPLLNKVVREIPGIFGQWRRGWEDAIRKADTLEELQRLERLLDQKVSLRKEIQQASISEDKRRGQLRFVMQMRNDVEKRRQELAKDIKSKRDADDRVTREAAQKLQSMDKLGRDNRTRFMNRIARGEDVRKVLTNADKLQRDRTAKQRVETERKDLEQKQAQERKEQEQKTREYEKVKQAKLRSNTAKMLQGMSGLDRKNRQKFIQRLESGEEPSRVISNAQQRDASKRVRPTTGPQPSGRIAPRTKKMKAKNRTRAEVLKQQTRRR
jgi:hypothetical protein